MELIPKKSLGQHWLHDDKFLSAIADSANLTEKDTVIEIGPGLGTLTDYLVKTAGKVIAVELDRDLARQLPGCIIAKNLEVVNGDCLTFNYSEQPIGYKVVANIPYYLTSKILQTLSEAKNPPSTIVLLIQKEVAERVAARPGAMSLLSISVQLYYQAKLDLVAPAKFFTPPPKVDSQILILERHPKPLFLDLDEKKYFSVVKAGFSQRRKKLRSSLSAGLRITKEEATILLDTAGIDPNARPQELSLAQWHKLSLVA